MSDSFLNLTGLGYYHEKLKNLFATQSSVTTALNGKVDKVTGKQLSTNDYTTAEKEKLAAIASGAQVNVIETIKVNGTAQTITSKAVDITVPTALSDLTNDGNFVTDASYVHTDNNFTTSLKNKLDGIAAGAEVNQNAFSNVKVGETTVAADGKTDTLELAAGSNITLTPDTTNDKVTIAATVPTKLSDLTNDSDYVTDASYVHTDNNYTSDEKTKLSGIASGAQVNVIETVKVNNTALTVTNKAVNVVVPTALTDLTNDGNFVTDASYVHTDNNFTTTLKNKLDGIEEGATAITVDSAMSSTSTNPVQNSVIYAALGNKANLASPTFTGSPKAPTAAAGTNTTQIATTEFVTTAVANAIAGVTSITYQVVQSLPASGENGVIYLVAHSHGTGDVYDEYVWTGSSFEKLGNTDIDLSGYMLKTDMVAITTAEIDTLFA